MDERRDLPETGQAARGLPSDLPGRKLAGLNVSVGGAGEPALVFVHGFGCSLEDWRAQVETLSREFTCITLDLPGHGASDEPEEATMDALATAVNRAKASVAASSFVLIGHSLGAKVIRDAYCHQSRNVDGLVFIEGAYYEGDEHALVRKARQAIDAEGFRPFAERHFGAMFFDGSAPELRERILARVRRLAPSFARDLFLEAVGWDPLRGKATLMKLSVPVLVLQSTYVDAEFKRRPLARGMRTPFMNAVAQFVPAAEVKAIEGCGHFPLIEVADEVSNDIREFALKIARTKR